ELGEVGPPAKRRGCLTKNELIVLGKWKAARSAGHLLKNSDAFVEEATRTALHAESEELRIGALRLLHGVDWSLASGVLHCRHGSYPNRPSSENQPLAKSSRAAWFQPRPTGRCGRGNGIRGGTAASTTREGRGSRRHPLALGPDCRRFSRR